MIVVFDVSEDSNSCMILVTLFSSRIQSAQFSLTFHLRFLSQLPTTPPFDSSFPAP